MVNGLGVRDLDPCPGSVGGSLCISGKVGTSLSLGVQHL